MKQINPQMMHPAEQLVLIISKIYKKSMTTTSGGNLSIMDEKGDMWITPSAIDKGSLTPRDIMCVKADGTIIGPHKPSSEYPFHKAIYKMRPGMHAVIHAHPSCLVAFSIVHKRPDTAILPIVREVCGEVGFAPYGIPGSEDLGVKIAREFETHPQFKAVTMENHGIVLCGTDLVEAYTRFETLEMAARIQLNASMLGTPHLLSSEEIDKREASRPAPLPVQEVKVHGSEERALRTQIADLVHRGCDQGLMASAFGCVSARLSAHSFVITPKGSPRWQITPEELIVVTDGKAEAGKEQCPYTALHAAIYAQCPKVNSIIMAQPAALMGFAVSGAKFDVRTIPESWIFLQDVYQLPFGTPFASPEKITDILSTRPCVLVNSEMVIAACDRLIDTFDRLEVAEFSAQSLINTLPIGKLSPMSDNDIEDLRVAFHVQ